MPDLNCLCNHAWQHCSILLTPFIHSFILYQ